MNFNPFAVAFWAFFVGATIGAGVIGFFHG